MPKYAQGGRRVLQARPLARGRNRETQGRAQLQAAARGRAAHNLALVKRPSHPLTVRAAPLLLLALVQLLVAPLVMVVVVPLVSVVLLTL